MFAPLRFKYKEMRNLLEAVNHNVAAISIRIKASKAKAISGLIPVE